MTRRNEGDVVLFDHIGYGYGWSDPLNEFDGSSPHWSIKFQKKPQYLWFMKHLNPCPCIKIEIYPHWGNINISYLFIYWSVKFYACSNSTSANIIAFKQRNWKAPCNNSLDTRNWTSPEDKNASTALMVLDSWARPL